MIFNVLHKCGNCGKWYWGRPIVSTKDNKTPLCLNCAVEQAMDVLGVQGPDRDRIKDRVTRCENK